MPVVEECHLCRQPKSPLYQDRMFHHAICGSCFIARREQAAKALHTEWFLANVPFNQMSDYEKDMAGLRSPEEYRKAKDHE